MPCTYVVGTSDCALNGGLESRKDAADAGSPSVQARAFRRRIREASETRRLKRGSVARVRKVSLRIFE